MTLPEAKRVLPDTDATPETVVCPADSPLDHIYIPADRSIKRSTLVAAIAADETGLKPLIIVPRLTIERELYFWRYEVTKVIFEYQEHGFVTIQLLKNGLTKCSCLTMPNSENSRTILAGAFYIGRLHLPFAHFT
jgi:hypothetical protein